MAAVKVQKTASLSEPTVQKVARDQHQLPRQRRRSRKQNPDLAVTKVHPLAWEVIEDMKILDRRRIQICPDGSVIVWNHPAPWPGA